MSEPEEKKPEAAVVPKKGLSPLIAMVVTGLIAGGAAFGGAKVAAAHAAIANPGPERITVVVAPPPGPTVALEPFVLLTPDASKKMHAMRVTLAIEFEEKTKEETLKSYTPRVRDAALTYLRTMTYEDAIDNAKTDKLRADLLEKFRTVGAVAASRVLITDLVVQ
jgi:flagellar basal body-associated protein FliL